MTPFHKISHLIKINKGYCEAYYDKDGNLMMSFVCNECGERSGIHCIDRLVDRFLNLK